MNNSEAKAQYLAFYKAADEVLKQPGNPCDIRMESGIVTCTVSRTGHKGFPNGSLCCGGCKHLDPQKGCTVQSLSCKLGWCYITRNTIEGMQIADNPMFAALKQIRGEAYASGIPILWRRSLEETFPSKA